MAKKYEHCFLCESLTGRTGRADDSIYDDDGNGPYCEDCHKLHPGKFMEDREWLCHAVDCCCGHPDCPGSHPEIFPKRN